jgi:glycosyltransferase involved in cell wall biosynthesis
MRLSAHRAETVVTISESSRRDIVQFLGLSSERVTVIYTGVSPEFFTVPPPAEARQALAGRYPVDRPYLLYVGALEQPNKNLVRLLQAYAQARSHLATPPRLLLVGPKRFRSEEVFAEIERLGLAEDARWLGYIPHNSDLLALYAGAEAFVYVSQWEGFGMPVLEAMAAGTPVVTSNASSLPEVVGEAGLLVDPMSVGDISAAIVRLLEDDGLRADLRLAARDRARQFTWESSAQRLVQILEQLK